MRYASFSNEIFYWIRRKTLKFLMNCYVANLTAISFLQPAFKHVCFDTAPILLVLYGPVSKAVSFDVLLLAYALVSLKTSTPGLFGIARRKRTSLCFVFSNVFWNLEFSLINLLTCFIYLRDRFKIILLTRSIICFPVSSMRYCIPRTLKHSTQLKEILLYLHQCKWLNTEP